jgi:hypothetical protein
LRIEVSFGLSRNWPQGGTDSDRDAEKLDPVVDLTETSAAHAIGTKAQYSES